MFLFYILALGAVLAMSTACLSATESGYFSFDQQIHINIVPNKVDAEGGIDIDYEVNGRFILLCCRVIGAVFFFLATFSSKHTGDVDEYKMTLKKV